MYILDNIHTILLCFFFVLVLFLCHTDWLLPNVYVVRIVHTQDSVFCVCRVVCDCLSLDFTFI